MVFRVRCFCFYCFFLVSKIIFSLQYQIEDFIYLFILFNYFFNKKTTHLVFVLVNFIIESLHRLVHHFLVSRCLYSILVRTYYSIDVVVHYYAWRWFGQSHFCIFEKLFSKAWAWMFPCDILRMWTSFITCLHHPATHAHTQYTYAYFLEWKKLVWRLL